MNIKQLFCHHKWFRDKVTEVLIFYHTSPSKYEGKNIIRCSKCLKDRMIDVLEAQ